MFVKFEKNKAQDSPNTTQCHLDTEQMAILVLHTRFPHPL